MAFIKSSKGKNKLIHESHVYVFSKKTSDLQHSIWVCEKRTICKGRVWTLGESPNVVNIVQGHLHPADASRSEALRVLDTIKDRARSTQESSQQILSAAMVNVHANVCAALPRKDSLKRSIRMVRQTVGNPPLPLNIEDLVIPEVSFNLCVRVTVLYYFLFTIYTLISTSFVI